MLKFLEGGAPMPLAWQATTLIFCLGLLRTASQELRPPKVKTQFKVFRYLLEGPSPLGPQLKLLGKYSTLAPGDWGPPGLLVLTYPMEGGAPATLLLEFINPKKSVAGAPPSRPRVESTINRFFQRCSHVVNRWWFACPNFKRLRSLMQ